MKISLEDIVAMVVKEVIAELKRNDVEIVTGNSSSTKNNISLPKEKTQHKMDFSKFKTPLVTEEQIRNLSSNIKEIIVPKGTLLTPNARDLIRKRNLTLISDIKTNS